MMYVFTQVSDFMGDKDGKIGMQALCVTLGSCNEVAKCVGWSSILRWSNN